MAKTKANPAAPAAVRKSASRTNKSTRATSIPEVITVAEDVQEWNQANFRLVPRLCREDENGCFIGLQTECDGLRSLLNAKSDAQSAFAIVVHLTGEAEEGALVLGQTTSTGELRIVRSTTSDHKYKDGYCELNGEDSERLEPIGPIVQLHEIVGPDLDRPLPSREISDHLQECATRVGLSLLMAEKERGEDWATIDANQVNLDLDPIFGQLRRQFDKGYAAATGSQARRDALNYLCACMFRAGQLSGVHSIWDIKSDHVPETRHTWRAGRVT